MDELETLVLVRHGRTRLNAEKRYQGHSMAGLDEVGRMQARALAGVLGGGFDGVWTSDLLRAQQTAELAGFTDARPDARLRELDFGEMEGKRWDDLEGWVQRLLLGSELEAFRPPGGETLAEFRLRVRGFMQEHGRGRVLVFGHGGIFRVLGVEQPDPGGMLILPGRVVRGALR